MQIVLAFRDKLALARSGRDNLGAALQTMATRSAIFALSIGTGVITARTMGPEGRGLLAALLTWPQFIAFLTTFGLTSSLLYNVKTNPLEKGRLLATATCLAVVAGAIACAIGVILMPWMLPGYGASELNIARLLMATAPIILVAMVIQTAAEATGDFPGANALRGLSVAGILLSIATLARTGSLTPTTAAVSYLLPQVPLTVWLFLRLRGDYKPTLHGFRRTSFRLLSYGIRCYPIELLNTALSYVGQAMVITMLAPAEVGYFTVAIGVGRMLEIVYTTVATVLLPATAGRNRTDITNRTLRASRLTLLVMLVVLTPLALAIPVIMPMIYGPDFVNAASVARVLLLEAAISGTVWVMLQAFLAVGRPEYPTILQIVALIASVTLLFVIVPRYGALGAAEVLLAVAVLKLSIGIILYRTVLGASSEQIMPSRNDLRYVKELMSR
jgi:O-antigen/teichoic acid export membrane protein